ncbi:Molybdenum cofactor sulfurase [Tolypocladium capitatum]|uniref:Molybdenum cofactor sulfurase n=1 Tax=Tolypocladium capitatum TaxID=45235 RepID=A0A2K3QCU9_9HYPO|nr:Molybdenum cofactor sulfurase [Tolypocladium capitatum]
MGSISEAFPEYAATGKLDHLRSTQYSYLEKQDHAYLDYTGAGLAARAQYEEHLRRLTSSTFGNPHSANPTSQLSTELVERTRKRVLDYLNASPTEYTAIFTANATGAIRLVGEGYPFARHSRLVLTSDNHNSVNGLREFASRAGGRVVYVPMRSPDLRIDTATVEAALCRPKPRLFARPHRALFAFPAQSNFTGVRHPLSWVKMAQNQGYDVLLDAAAYLPTATLDLSAVKPEFVVVSWYKLFGFPTGVGCLIVRRDALARLSRPWFSGGAVKAVTVGVLWHMQADDEAAFEDGTVNFLSIPDVHFGLDWLCAIGMDLISTRVRCLTGWTIKRLQSLEHSDGSPMVRIYGPKGTDARGGTVSFSLFDAAGRMVDERLVAAESAAANISLRTGCFCNPGAGENAFGIRVDVAASQRLTRARETSLDEILRVLKLPTAGAIRVSFGIASNVDDIDRFVDFAERTYRDRTTTADGLPPRSGC